MQNTLVPNEDLINESPQERNSGTKNPRIITLRTMETIRFIFTSNHLPISDINWIVNKKRFGLAKAL